MVGAQLNEDDVGESDEEDESDDELCKSLLCEEEMPIESDFDYEDGEDDSDDSDDEVLEANEQSRNKVRSVMQVYIWFLGA